VTYLFPVLAFLLIVALAIWGRRFRAYGLALVPSRRILGESRHACRVTGIDELTPDRVMVVMEPVDDIDPTAPVETISFELDDRELALETLRTWQENATPLAVTNWGERLVRIRRLDDPTGLTLRRTTTR
jgi:hypothetical protein